MITIETFLPVFPGFYGTIFEANVEDELWYQNDCRDTDLPIIEPVDLLMSYQGWDDYTELSRK